MKRSNHIVLSKVTSKCLQMMLLFSLVTLFVFSPCAVKRGIQSLLAKHTELRSDTPKKEIKGIFFNQYIVNKSGSDAKIANYRCLTDDYITQKDESGTDQLNLLVSILPDFLYLDKPVEKKLAISGMPDLKPQTQTTPLFLQNRNILI